MFPYVDDDECALGTDNCNTNAACTNTVGSFTCACNEGYSGDGVTCAGQSGLAIKICLAKFSTSSYNMVSLVADG